MLSGVIGIFVGDTALFACMNRLSSHAGPRPAVCPHSLFGGAGGAVLDESLKGWAVPGGVLLVGGVMGAIALGRREGRRRTSWSRAGLLAGAWRFGAAVGLGQSVAHVWCSNPQWLRGWTSGCIGRADDGGLCPPMRCCGAWGCRWRRCSLGQVARPGLHLCQCRAGHRPNGA